MRKRIISLTAVLIVSIFAALSSEYLVAQSETSNGQPALTEPVADPDGPINAAEGPSPSLDASSLEDAIPGETSSTSGESTDADDDVTNVESSFGADETSELTPPENPQPELATEDALAEDVDVEEEDGAEELLRGPVHEAFAEPITLDVEESPLIPKAPPEPIEEIPPEIDDTTNAVWIPGYWAWDDDQRDFVWVSGVWRKAPKGRVWVPGQWVKENGGYRWVAGYWTKPEQLAIRQILPTPPQTLEQGPTVAQPSADHFWIPGCWQYQNTRYVWRPGFWSPSYQNWVWVPEHYVWQPNGCVYVPGYWDYHWDRRGSLFAPVYFSSPIYRTAGYRYRPRVVVGFGTFFDHLWVRPGYRHYYFGDYYSNYQTVGLIPWYAYATRARYYDPLYWYQRWALRDAIHDLHHYYHDRHRFYHTHPDARPHHRFRDYYRDFHRRGRSQVVQNNGGQNPTRLTGAAFAARVEDIVRQQHRNRHRSQLDTQTAGAQNRSQSSRNPKQRPAIVNLYNKGSVKKGNADQVRAIQNKQRFVESGSNTNRDNRGRNVRNGNQVAESNRSQRTRIDRQVKPADFTSEGRRAGGNQVSASQSTRSSPKVMKQNGRVQIVDHSPRNNRTVVNKPNVQRTQPNRSKSNFGLPGRNSLNANSAKQKASGQSTTQPNRNSIGNASQKKQTTSYQVQRFNQIQSQRNQIRRQNNGVRQLPNRSTPQVAAPRTTVPPMRKPSANSRTTPNRSIRSTPRTTGSSAIRSQSRSSRTPPVRNLSVPQGQTQPSRMKAPTRSFSGRGPQIRSQPQRVQPQRSFSRTPSFSRGPSVQRSAPRSIPSRSFSAPRSTPRSAPRANFNRSGSSRGRSVGRMSGGITRGRGK